MEKRAFYMMMVHLNYRHPYLTFKGGQWSEARQSERACIEEEGMKSESFHCRINISIRMSY